MVGTERKAQRGGAVVFRSTDIRLKQVIKPGTKKDPVTQMEGPRGNTPGTKCQGEAAKGALRERMKSWMDRDSPTRQQLGSEGGEGERGDRGGGGGRRTWSVVGENEKEEKGKGEKNKEQAHARTTGEIREVKDTGS